jgi:hypothetical protein
MRSFEKYNRWIKRVCQTYAPDPQSELSQYEVCNGAITIMFGFGHGYQQIEVEIEDFEERFDRIMNE